MNSESKDQRSDEKVALYGGSFDPIHFGHLNLAIQMLENEGLDRVFFCPNKKNPLKESSQTSPKDRLQMVQLAIEPIPQFQVLNWELEREGPSYTVDTLEQLSKLYKNISLIVGEDTVSSFHEWKDWKRIEQLAKILIGPRTKNGKSEKGCRVVEMNSTDIRERLSKGLYCGHLLPKIVLDYIYNHQLYSTTNYER